MIVKFEGLAEGKTIKIGDILIIGIGKEEENYKDEKIIKKERICV